MALATTTLAACSDDPSSARAGAERSSSEPLRLNQLQLIGSHNSYHVGPAGEYFDKLVAAAEGLGEQASSLGDVTSLAYTHAPLATQLDRGTRSFEIDVWADPAGGLFSKPAAPDFLGAKTTIPTGLDQPGFKVLHIVDIDFESTCQVFVGCLRDLLAWSNANSGHLPIVILVELKDDPLPKPLDVTKVVPIDAAQMDALDAEIRSVLQPDKLITPDLVRGAAPTLREAVSTTGWPKVADVRGRFMFLMDDSDKREEYLVGHPSLAGRVLFTSSGEAQPDGAVLKENDPGDGSRIASLVGQGYFVRTRADADLAEARSNDTARREVTFASGAQVVSTDFPVGEANAGNGFVVAFDGPVQARCNPVAAPPACPAPLEP